jgi:hypothetical protein
MALGDSRDGGRICLECPALTGLWIGGHWLDLIPGRRRCAPCPSLCCIAPLGLEAASEGIFGALREFHDGLQT